MSTCETGAVYSDSLTVRDRRTVGEGVRPASAAAVWRPRIRPADLSKIENSSTSISISDSHHRSVRVDVEHERLRTEAAVGAALRWEESETEFISCVPKSDGRTLERDKSTRSYGAITQVEGSAAADDEEREGLISSGKRKQSVAFAGKAYEKVASRNKRAEHATTNTETAMHLLKGNIGIGLLALPLAVYNAGLIVGAVGLLLMGLIATHCMMQLVACSKELCRRFGVKTLDYAEVAQFAVLECTEKDILGKIARHTVNVFLLITQFGFCSAYFVFMAYSLDQVFCISFDVNIGQRAWIGILMLPVIVLSWIRNLNELAYFSMVANVCIVITLAIILYEEITSFITLVDDEKAAVLKGSLDLVSISTLPLFFGKAIYAYEGIGIILPLENKMKNHEDALKVIFFSMMVVTVLFTMFGVVGYIVYSSDIRASITLNLISSNLIETIFYIIAKIFFAYATLASFLLQFYVPMDFLEPAILEQMTKKHNGIKLLVQILFRSVVVLFLAGIAMAVPDLDDLISLIGAVASSTLALIFPSLLSILIFWRVRHETLWLGCLPWPVWVVKDLLITLLGVVGSLFGTYTALDNIVTYFKENNAAEKACDITYFPHL